MGSGVEECVGFGVIISTELVNDCIVSTTFSEVGFGVGFAEGGLVGGLVGSG